MGTRPSRTQAAWRLAIVPVACLLISAVAAAAAAVASPDLDLDGVPDSLDRCAYTAPRTRVDARGCSSSADQDGDRVVDEADDCPYSPRAAQVDGRGCAVDDDLDGVANGIDACARSAPGLRVDARGCAVGQPGGRPAATSSSAAAATPSTVLSTFSFAALSVSLDSSSQAKLRAALPGLRRSLAASPTQVLELRGYADPASDGDRAAVLAKGRATKLRETLQALGVDPQRMRVAAQWPGPVSARRADLVLVSR